MNTENVQSGRRHRDVYRSFYTTDGRLASYMVGLLGLRDGESCLEPAAGSGCFVDEVLATRKTLTIAAVELSESAASDLRRKYSGVPSVTVLEEDFLAEDGLLWDLGSFDKVISNPPYGAWQEYGRRTRLKSLFPGHYVRETYGLFLVRSLARLRPNGRAVFIVPDTFLYLHLQKALRALLLERYSIASIDIVPSSVFPGVRFGYAKLCIIAIDNRVPSVAHRVQIRHVDSAEALLRNADDASEVDQRAVMERRGHGFPLHGRNADTTLIDTAATCLGDVADCVTGFYSGNDTAFLRRAATNGRGARKYVEVEQDRVYSEEGGRCSVDGVAGSRVFVPILKGGGSAYLKPEMWFVDWSKAAVEHYRADRKARFQNSRFYFQRGIGFPMVTSGRATASVICAHWMFDQSVVGVFPKDEALFGYLLAFLNSPTCWRLLRQINPSANNSARYLRRLPIVCPAGRILQWFNEVVGAYVSALADGGERSADTELLLQREIARTYDDPLVCDAPKGAAQQGAAPDGRARRSGRG